MNLPDLISKLTASERAELRRMLEEPAEEPKSFGEVAFDAHAVARDLGSVWAMQLAHVHERWERAAAAVITEHERRNPRKVPSVDEVARTIMRSEFPAPKWDCARETHREACRAAARAVFPLFGCEP